MKTIHAMKAQGLRDSTSVESVTIVIDEVFTAHIEYDDVLRAHRENARVIVDALYAALPGGTFDALLIEILDRKRSALVVPL